MRIAIPVEGELVCEHYSDAKLFGVYEVHDENFAVHFLGRKEIDAPGCENTAPQLRKHGVECVVVADISQNGINKLLEFGILTIKDIDIQKPDAVVAQLVSGTLKCTTPDPAMHHHNASSSGGCGGGGCAHCRH